jgi:hypothetical protein
VGNPEVVSSTTPGFPTNIYHLNKRQKQMKEPLSFPQTYIISTKYKTQQQMVSFVVVFCILLR